MSSAINHIRQAAVFAAHLPLRRVLRRAWLTLKRRVAVHVKRWSSAPRRSLLAFRPEGFDPLFRPAARALAVTPDGLSFSFLGRTVPMGRTVCWHPDIDPPVGQLWTMNLHYMEYLAGAPDPLFAELTTQWIAANPCYGSDYWRDAWHAYALSVRTVVWMEELARRGAGVLPQGRERICASIEEQLGFLARNIERDIGGNHVIKNIRALATGGRLFEGASARRWTEAACRLIQEELGEQILADGGHFERSPSYHGQVFADLLAIRQSLAQSADVERGVIARIDAALQPMAQFVADLAHPDGLVALFNDAGLTMATTPDTLLSTYEAVYGSRPQPRADFAFPQSGYFGFRRDDVYLVVDCGPLGPDALMAHAHGDALSFELSAGGRRLVVDQGVCAYAAGDRRAMARSARSHNTVHVEGSDQAEFFGAFRCGLRPKVELLQYSTGSDGFVLAGRHDGFSRLSGGPRHERRFDVTRRCLTIHDRLDGPAATAVSSSLLIHPDVRIEQDGSRIRLVCGEICVSVESNTAIVIEPAVHWPDMGVEIATWRLRFRWPSGAQEATIVLRLAQQLGSASVTTAS